MQLPVGRAWGLPHVDAAVKSLNGSANSLCCRQRHVGEEFAVVVSRTCEDVAFVRLWELHSEGQCTTAGKHMQDLEI